MKNQYRSPEVKGLRQSALTFFVPDKPSQVRYQCSETPMCLQFGKARKGDIGSSPNWSFHIVATQKCMAILINLRFAQVYRAEMLRHMSSSFTLGIIIE